jgi:hypothetical protein
VGEVRHFTFSAAARSAATHVGTACIPSIPTWTTNWRKLAFGGTDEFEEAEAAAKEAYEHVMAREFCD